MPRPDQEMVGIVFSTIRGFPRTPLAEITPQCDRQICDDVQSISVTEISSESAVAQGRALLPPKWAGNGDGKSIRLGPIADPDARDGQARARPDVCERWCDPGVISQTLSESHLVSQTRRGGMPVERRIGSRTFPQGARTRATEQRHGCLGIIIMHTDIILRGPSAGYIESSPSISAGWDRILGSGESAMRQSRPAAGLPAFRRDWLHQRPGRRGLGATTGWQGERRPASMAIHYRNDLLLQRAGLQTISPPAVDTLPAWVLGGASTPIQWQIPHDRFWVSTDSLYQGCKQVTRDRPTNGFDRVATLRSRTSYTSTKAYLLDPTMSAANRTGNPTGFPLGLSESDYNDLLRLGFLAQALGPYHNTTMAQTVDLLLAPNSPVNLTTLLGPVLAASGGAPFGPGLALQALKLVLEQVPHDNVSFQNVTTYITMTAVSVAFVIVRLYSRHFVTKKIRPEDWAMIPAIIVSVLLGAAFALGSDERVGKGTLHQWDLSYNEFKMYLLWLWLCEILYPVALFLVRNSLLIFYWSLVPPRSSAVKAHLMFRNAVIAFFFVNIACVSVSLGTIIFQCKPIAYWNDPIGAKCIDRSASFIAGGILIIITDVIVLLLPVPVIWKLKLPLRSRLGVIGIFSLGLFACIASVNRIILASEVTNSTNGDVTYTNAKNLSGTWSLLEVNIGIIASCVPAIKALFVHGSERSGMTNRSRTNQSGRSGRSGGNTVESAKAKIASGKREVIGKDGSVELTVTTSVTVTSNTKTDLDLEATIIEDDDDPQFTHYSRPFRPSEGNYGHDYEITYVDSDNDSRSLRASENSPSEYTYRPESRSDTRWNPRLDSVQKPPSFI
ncbi:LOW QUALITY PROTEIN: hypothetical protein Dda_8675 [Drechslerella dactyloides]|uniref:Rhodopsin domain-containing protein n=1 Tax=Drechslerella dactyloides TaxID=74499 RepID=A0AAD6NG23_DREDA|nr:LOW QUALITY PROTEIN: hypothetical protein Dda_8675 [Drechslerella dactyloides]